MLHHFGLEAFSICPPLYGGKSECQMIVQILCFKLCEDRWNIDTGQTLSFLFQDVKLYIFGPILTVLVVQRSNR